ncbi:MAG: hydrogenase maturation nickel metallochaperone HypA [Deltaproteobacteria bacterium]|nr:hydrogenase maturation nickel metallochaperone HypA [Deltaproteobacteria bacterium]MBW2068767.1 hydrogenase maturation nickel metallochaperone HypA [Deltaproteobacteria bacterium]
MHEMAIAQALLDVVLAEAEDHNLIMVDRVVVQVGEMAAVVPKSLEFCFSILANHTAASGAKLIIEVTPVVARCSNCGEVFEVENFSFECPECSFVATECVSGRELMVVSVEGVRGRCDGEGSNSGN